VATIADNLRHVQDRVARAAEGCGRRANEITIVGVTKYAGVQAARELYFAGCKDLGESRPQELAAKAAALADLPIAWHMIGHLQRNKVRLTPPHIAWIHSVDSMRLVESLNDAYITSPKPVVPILLEVRISPDESKHGFTPEELPAILNQMRRFERVSVQGLMTMASRAGGPAVAGREFAQLRDLRDRCAASAPESVSLDQLSMGMSGDFEEAIREGATFVRIGSALFEGVAR
jgi:pyridoxal phosphate enzyme (YggS family)